LRNEKLSLAQQEKWLTKAEAPESDQSEPLFKWHCEELVKFDAKVEAAARLDAERQLGRLERMRNAAAHEGDPLLGDDEADFLAAVAGEIIFMAFDDPESLCIEPRAAERIKNLYGAEVEQVTRASLSRHTILC